MTESGPPNAVPPLGATGGPGAPLPYETPGLIEMNPEARNWGMLCHLSVLAMLTGIPFAHILGPLVVWLLKKDQYPFVNDQGKESLNFQITVTLGWLLCIPLALVFCLGLFLAIAIFVAMVVLVIVAAVKASNGERYRYPFTLRLVN